MKIILFILLLLISTVSFTFSHQRVIAVSDNEALTIGMKIWFNESGGKLTGLVMWNQGEKCASLGIGHFTWYPYPLGSANDGFPQFVKYLRQQGIAVPNWLRADAARYAIWSNREEFIAAEASRQMYELRIFLQESIAMQARFMAHQLETVLPKLLANIPPHERPYVCTQFYKLAHTEAGLYAMMDYLNFRGNGASNSYGTNNTGLLRVLQDMRYAPPMATPVQAFTWSAKNALTRRLAHASEDSQDTHWIVGWLKRVDRYEKQ